MESINEFDQLIGRDLGGWSPPEMVPHEDLHGGYVDLRPLVDTDAESVFEAMSAAPDHLWTYMTFEPFRTVDDVSTLLSYMLAQPDWRPYVVVTDGLVEGFASYLRINPPDGVIEIGSILYSPRLQRTSAATEAIYLLARNAFDSGYRRVEWKCDALNLPSRQAGERIGFRYEGTFVNATHYKGRNRDTAWFAMSSEEWPTHRIALEAWLNPDNFDQNGFQLRPLSEYRSGPTYPSTPSDERISNTGHPSVARPDPTDVRVVFDFDVSFSNGGGIQGQDFRLDIGEESIDDHALAALIVENLRLLMVDGVAITNKRYVRERHKRR